MNTLQKIEQALVAKETAKRSIPDFSPGDTVRVNVRVIEGGRERVQAYEGVVIARKNSGINSSFTVRKISLGEGVERIFPLYSPRLESIKLVRRGGVRRAKLYYLRDRRGKSARIAELGLGVSSEAATAAEAAERAEPAGSAEAALKAEKTPKAEAKMEKPAAAAKAQKTAGGKE